MVGAVAAVSATGRLTVSRSNFPVSDASSIMMPTFRGVPLAKLELGVPVITPVLDNDSPSVAQVVPSDSNPIDEVGGLPDEDSASWTELVVPVWTVTDEVVRVYGSIVTAIFALALSPSDVTVTGMVSVPGNTPAVVNEKLISPVDETWTSETLVVPSDQV
jgi:hypothetical protein